MLMVIKQTKKKTVSYNPIVPGSESLEITPRFSIKLCERMATDSECQFLSMIPLFYVPQQLKTRQVNFPYFVQCMLKSHSSCSVRPVISLHATAAFWQSIRNTGTRYWLLNVFFIILYKNIVNIDLRLFHLCFLSAEIANSVPASKPQQTQFSCLMPKQHVGYCPYRIVHWAQRCVPSQLYHLPDVVYACISWVRSWETSCQLNST